MEVRGLTLQPGLRLFCLQDRIFARPKAFAFILLRSPSLYASPAASIAAEAYQLLLTDALQDVTYPASQAGLSVGTGVTWQGLSISLAGFDQRLPGLASLVASTVRTLPLDDPIAFERRREGLQRQLANLAQRQPAKLVAYHRGVALQSPRYTNSALEAACRRLTLDDLHAFQATLLNEADIEAFVCGNVRPEEAAQIISELQRALPMAPLPAGRQPSRRIRQVPLGGHLQQFVAANPAESNSATEQLYQVGTDEGDTWVTLALLAQLMNKPFYASLRTQQQLGYVVQCSATETDGVRALSLLVQSATVSPLEVERRMDAFVAGFRATLLAASEDEIASLGRKLARQYVDVDNRLDSQASRLWAECSLRRYDFTRPWSNAAAARRVTKQSLIDMYDSFVAEGGMQRRRLSTQVFSQAMAPPRSQLAAPQMSDVFFDARADRLDEALARART